jgi:hypothetical protein
MTDSKGSHAHEKESVMRTEFMLNWNAAGNKNQPTSLSSVSHYLALANGKFTERPEFYTAQHKLSHDDLRKNPDQEGIFMSRVSLPWDKSYDFLQNIEAAGIGYEAGPKSNIKFPGSAKPTQNKPWGHTVRKLDDGSDKGVTYIDR